MSCHTPLALAAAPPSQFHSAGLLQGMEAAGFTDAGEKEERGRSRGCTGARCIQNSGSRAERWVAEWKLRGWGCWRGEGVCSGKTHCALGHPSVVAALAGQTPRSQSLCHCPGSPGCPHQHEGCREERTWWGRGQAGGSLPQP